MNTTNQMRIAAHMVPATVQDAIAAGALNKVPKDADSGDLWGYTLPDGTTRKLPAKLSGLAKVNAWHFAPNSVRQRIRAHYGSD